MVSVLTVIKSTPEKYWSLGFLVSNDLMIGSEAIPYLLAVQQWAENKKDYLGHNFEPIKIRQVQWISRLCKCVGNLSQMNEEEKAKALEWLWGWSKVYSIEEKRFALQGNPNLEFDTFELDKLLLNKKTQVGIAGENTYIINSEGHDPLMGTTNIAWLKMVEKTNKNMRMEKKNERLDYST